MVPGWRQALLPPGKTSPNTPHPATIRAARSSPANPAALNRRVGVSGASASPRSSADFSRPTTKLCACSWSLLDCTRGSPAQPAYQTEDVQDPQQQGDQCRAEERLEEFGGPAPIWAGPAVRKHAGGREAAARDGEESQHHTGEAGRRR